MNLFGTEPVTKTRVVRGKKKTTNVSPAHMNAANPYDVLHHSPSLFLNSPEQLTQTGDPSDDYTNIMDHDRQ